MILRTVRTTEKFSKSGFANRDRNPGFTVEPLSFAQESSAHASRTGKTNIYQGPIKSYTWLATSQGPSHRFRGDLQESPWSKDGRTKVQGKKGSLLHVSFFFLKKKRLLKRINCSLQVTRTARVNSSQSMCPPPCPTNIRMNWPESPSYGVWDHW